MNRLILISLSTLLFILPLGAQNTSSMEKKRARLEKEISELDKRLKDNRKAGSNAMASLEIVRQKISRRNEIIKETDRQMAGLSGDINSKRRELDALQGRLDTLSAYHSRLVASAYRNRDTKVWYMYLLASDNLPQAMRRVGYFKNISVRINQQGEKIIATRKEIEQETEVLNGLYAQASALKAGKEREVKALQGEEKDAEALVGRLRKEEKKYRKQLDTKRRQVDNLNREIARMIRQASRKAASGQSGKGAQKGTSKTTVDTVLDKEFALNKGRLPWPVDGPVTEPFGARNHPVFSNVQLPFNNGIGISVAEGTPVKAVFDGIVRQIVVMPGYNKCILVQHGGYFTFYCRLASVSVKAGDKIKTGAVIGKVDSIAGESSLHFQLWKGESPQNPSLWLK